MTIKSFIDLLFILLLSTIVLLTESVRLGRVDTDLLRLGGGGVSPVRADEVEVVLVAADTLTHHGDEIEDAERLAARLDPGASVLLVVADRDLMHRRVLEVWSALRARGFRVNLGVESTGADASDGAGA